MTTEAHRRAAQNASHREQRAAKVAAEALDDKSRIDFLSLLGVECIVLSDGSSIPVRGVSRSLRDVLDAHRFDVRHVHLPAAAVAAGAALDCASIEQGEPS